MHLSSLVRHAFKLLPHLTQFLALLPLLGMQAATTRADAGSPIAHIEAFFSLKCLPPAPQATVQELTLTTDVACYNLSMMPLSYKAYLLDPLPAGFSRCALNLFAYPDCVLVTNDSGPLKVNTGHTSQCIDVLNDPPGAKSASLRCDK